jgi:hypothetical protein
MPIWRGALAQNGSAMSVDAGTSEVYLPWKINKTEGDGAMLTHAKGCRITAITC